MKTPSQDYIDMICSLYGDTYDDRKESSEPGGLDWFPGQKAMHKSLSAFKRELAEVHGIKLSTSKILKILITGHRWTTERTREVQYLYEIYMEEAKKTEESGMPEVSEDTGGRGLNRDAVIRRIADELEISIPMVCMSLPYGRVVYDVPGKSSNAVRCDRSRMKRGVEHD